MAKIRTNITLSEEIFNKLEKYCQENNIPKSRVVEKALELYLKKEIVDINNLVKDFIDAYMESFRDIHKDIAEELEKIGLFIPEIVIAIPSPLHMFIVLNPEFMSPDPLYKRFIKDVTHNYWEYRAKLGKNVHRITIFPYLNEKFNVKITVEKDIINMLSSYTRGSVIYEALKIFYFDIKKVLNLDIHKLKKLGTIIAHYFASFK